MKKSSKQSNYSFKILVLGDGGIGKTCLVQKYESDEFQTEQNLTRGIEPVDAVEVVEGDEVNLKIIDSAGQEEQRAIPRSTIKEADGFILAQSITNQESFENIKKVWIKEIENNCSEKFNEMALIATKCDLESERKVKTEEGSKLAIELNLKFSETSSKTKKNVEWAFQTLARNLHKRKKLSKLSRDSAKRKEMPINLCTSKNSNTSKKGGDCC